MPHSTPVIFKRTLVAVTVLSLSACASMPTELSDVGAGIVNAGKATASASRNTWNATTYLLGFSDSKQDGTTKNPSDEQLLIADGDVNQVLPLADAPADDADDLLSGVDNPVLVEQATTAATETLTTEALKPAQQAIVARDDTSQGEEDLIHEVATNETLWDIAKMTTGDANNWHVLADVNNLTQNASVFPGQQLVIPSSMVKPNYDTPVEDTVADAQETVEATQEQLADSSRLVIPDAAANTTDTTEQLAQSAADAAQQIEDKAAQLAAASQNATPYELDIGETLWDFSKRTTGDALNWKAIAAQNSFSEKQAVTVRPGQTIFVPQSLLSTDAAAPVAAADDAVIKIEEDVVETAAISEEIVAPVAATAEQTIAAALPAASEVDESPAIETVEELAAEISILDETQPIQIVEATYKSDDTLAQTGTEIEPVQIVENDNIPANIMVSGTYYPKAVYNNADFSSSLLMRVSPGTTLQVSRAMGTWYEVETDKGVGYVHQRDIK